MRRSGEIRTLCASCRADYWDAGFKTVSIHAKFKEQCDRCRVRMGWTYRVVKKQKPDDKHNIG